MPPCVHAQLVRLDLVNSALLQTYMHRAVRYEVGRQKHGHMIYSPGTIQIHSDLRRRLMMAQHRIARSSSFATGALVGLFQETLLL